MRNRHFIKLFKHDLSVGVKQNAAKYVLAVFMFSFLCVMFFKAAVTIRDLPKGSFTDCAIFVFKGMEVYIPSPQNPFKIPVEWLTIQVLAAFLTVGYPTQDLHSYGIQILTRTKKRLSWWLSKCVWNVITVALFYLIGLVVIFVFTLIFGRLSLAPGQEINLLMNTVDLSDIRMSELAIAIFLLPLLTSIALSLMQMTLSFILNPVLSYLTIISILVASAYFCLPVFIGNFSMLLRNQLIYSEGSGNFTAIVVNLLIIIASVITGYFYFNKYDVLKKN